MSLRLAALFSMSFIVASGAVVPWSVARNGHFEIYSHRGADEARAALARFEQLRAIVTSRFALHLRDDPVTVFGFSSPAEYDPYRLRATADAYYVGTGDRDYIVMPALGPENYSTAAHEYAHLALHAAGLHLPAWLAEGLADVFSTVRVTARGVQLAGEPAGRERTLRAGPWLPLTSLLSLTTDSPIRETREGADIFYAQSWALTEMLLASPQYAPRFSQLLNALAKPDSSRAQTLEALLQHSALEHPQRSGKLGPPAQACTDRARRTPAATLSRDRGFRSPKPQSPTDARGSSPRGGRLCGSRGGLSPGFTRSAAGPIDAGRPGVHRAGSRQRR